MRLSAATFNILKRRHLQDDWLLLIKDICLRNDQFGVLKLRTEQIGALKPNENDLNKSSNQDHVPGRLVLLLQARDGEELARLLGRATGAFLHITRKSI